MIFYVKEKYLSLYMHFAWYVFLNHMISRKIICDPLYILREHRYFDKKTNLNPTIFPIMLITNIGVIYVDNLHSLLSQII